MSSPGKRPSQLVRPNSVPNFSQNKLSLAKLNADGVNSKSLLPRPQTVGKINIYQDEPMAAAAASFSSSNKIPNNAVPPLLARNGAFEASASLKNIFKKNIVGDIFGSNSHGESSMLGLMYRSRVESKKELEKKVKKEVNVQLEDSSDIIYDNSLDLDDDVDDSEDVNEAMQNLNPRQQLAVTIRNWSFNTTNDPYLIKEGAVHAIIALAVMDDLLVKKCCATALYQLSSREENKERLLSLGAGNGVIALCMQIKSWKIAKLCSMTLCNLSMGKNFEGNMAKDGAILALVVLMSIKGHHLLPICVQTLYNLTCVDTYYKGMERTVKAVMNLPHSDFDAISYIIKSFVNCSRFSWMRLRMIEDGAITIIASFASSLASNGKSGFIDAKRKERDVELLENVMIALRLLTESSGCRMELISKSTIDVLMTLMPHCDVPSTLLLIKSVHNLLQGTVLNIVQYEHALSLVASVITRSTDNNTLQYAAACIHVFSKDSYRGSLKQTLKVIDCLPKLLNERDEFTNFFSLVCTSLMFFNPLVVEKTKDIENLLKCFVACGLKSTGLECTKVFSLSMARLLQEPGYIAWLEKLGFLEDLLDYLLEVMTKYSDNLTVQESGCIGTCRLAMRLKSINDSLKETLSNILLNILDGDSLFLLENAISSVYSLGGQGSFQKQILTDALLLKVARTVMKFNSEIELCRTCCAALAVFSQNPIAHEGLAANEVLEMLFATITAKDVATREFVATTICNISSTNLICQEKLVDWGVVDFLSTLSGATNENIQDLCAKCICNLSHTPTLHKRIIEQKILETISMIALVRASQSSTKRLMARALLNLVTEENIDALIKSDAIRIFAVLSSVDCDRTQNICARGFLLFTQNPRRCEELSKHFSVMQTLCGMMTIEAEDTFALVGYAVCNLLECPESQFPSIKAGALSVLKIISTTDSDSLKEAASRIVINLVRISSLHEYLVREPLVEMLIHIVDQKEGSILSAALRALSAMSEVPYLRPYLIDGGSVHCLVNTVIYGKIISIDDALETMRSLCCLSYVRDKVYNMVNKCHIILAIHLLTANIELCTSQIARMAMIALRNLSFDSHVVVTMVSQDAIGLVRNLIKNHTKAREHIGKAAIIFFHNLSLVEKFHASLVEKGAIECIYTEILAHAVSIHDGKKDHLIPLSHHNENNLVNKGHEVLVNKKHNHDNKQLHNLSSPHDKQKSGGGGGHNHHHHRSSITSPTVDGLAVEKLLTVGDEIVLSTEEIYYLVRALNLLCNTAACHNGLIDSGIISMFVKLYAFQETRNCAMSCLEIATAISKLASSVDCREKMVNFGASWLLSDISKCSQLQTQKMCLLALGFLSNITTVKNGNVAAALILSLKVEHGNEVFYKNEISEGSEKSHAEKLAGIQKLSSMIKEGIQSRIEEHGVVVNEDIYRHDPIIKPIVALNLLDKPDYIETVKREAIFLEGSYVSYKFETIPHKITSRPGGVAKNNLVLLSLPTITVERAVMVPSLHDMLVKVPLRKECLKKDCFAHDPSKFTGGSYDEYTDLVKSTTIIANSTQQDNLPSFSRSGSPGGSSPGGSPSERPGSASRGGIGKGKGIVAFSPKDIGANKENETNRESHVTSKWTILKKGIGLGHLGMKK